MTATIASTSFAAPVAGGRLAGGQWHPDAAGTPVLAVHGITATHRSWDLFAEALPDRRVIAPDLRGRGRSNALPAPYTLVQHADDLAAVLDALGVDRVHVVGHSMGAFVSVRFAERHPDRVAGLSLVDGGLPVPNPDGIPADELPAVLLGPALERLSMTFRSRADYVAFWRRHPALGPYWSDAIEAYVDYDVDGREPALRSSANADAVAVNAVELDGSGGYTAALAALPGPVDVFRAPRGLLDEAPLYPEGLMARWAERMPQVVVHEIPDVNHYTIVMSDRGAGSVIPVIRARIEAAETQEGAT
ncbi:Pimeloyl-ACP methyl ester carboxylesterase [Agromyces sp. CF514]|uniref:alpha/beta fold hydrolase n=1 Tax=Agromyces sp. CF514 TaxID=1881031 RepID=UPI0008EFC082|nr:alpha/beta hydrolase [Agromyces sp. CF514]SFR87575.1 Pimeloyl-ACP methyl ester carboxylesterase [Agromyces sp. CF514]